MLRTKVTKEELIEKAKKPAQDAMKMHPYGPFKNRRKRTFQDR
jgi:hypothetical protein